VGSLRFPPLRYKCCKSYKSSGESEQEDGIVFSFPYMYNGSLKTVIMGYNVKFKLKNEICTIGGVPLYDCFLESELFS